MHYFCHGGEEIAFAEEVELGRVFCVWTGGWERGHVFGEFPEIEVARLLGVAVYCSDGTGKTD